MTKAPHSLFTADVSSYSPIPSYLKKVILIWVAQVWKSRYLASFRIFTPTPSPPPERAVPRPLSRSECTDLKTLKRMQQFCLWTFFRRSRSLRNRSKHRTFLEHTGTVNFHLESCCKYWNDGVIPGNFDSRTVFKGVKFWKPRTFYWTKDKAFFHRSLEE